MDNYVVMEIEDAESNCVCPFPENLTKDIPRFKIKKHTKTGRILARAEKDIQREETKRMIFQGVGPSCERCISCVEQFKRKYEGRIFQWNILTRVRATDKWAPVSDKNLDNLLVEKSMPAIFIMVSRDPFPEEFGSSSLSQQISDEVFPSFLGKGPTNETTKGAHRQSKNKGDRTTNKWRRPEKRKGGAQEQVPR